MDDPLRVIADAQGVFLRREALEAGFTDKAIAAHVRAGAWRRVRHGAYCVRDQWDPLTAEQRHLVLAKAVLRTTTGPVVLSHITALIAHGAAVWNVDLKRVHVTRLDRGAGRLERDVAHHVGVYPVDAVTTIDGMPVVHAARAVIESCTLLHLEAALVPADNVLFRRLCTESELREEFTRCNHWPGSQKIHVVLNRVDGRHESPGETRSDYLFWRHGLPRPEPQWLVYDSRGVLVARLDFAWPDLGVWAEFDGKVKYVKLLKANQRPEDAVFEEKQREDLVRGLTQWMCGRIVNHDLETPRLTAERFRQLFRLAAKAGAARLTS